MPIITPWNPDQLINASGIDVPLVQQLATLVNTLYVIIGGVVGLSILLFLIRMRQNMMMKQRIATLEARMRALKRDVEALQKKSKR